MISKKFMIGNALVDLDGAVDASHERISGQETDGTREQTVDCTGQEAVCEE